MKRYILTHIQTTLFLLGAFMVGLGPVKETYAGIVQADVIRSAVIDTLNAVADRNGYEIELSITYSAHVDVQGVDEPGIHVIVPDMKTLNSYVRAKVEFFNSENDIVRQVTVVARIKLFTVVAVTAVDVKRGETIGQNNIVMEKKNISAYKDFFVSPDELEEMQAKRTMKAGTVLSQNNVESIPVIKRGEKVVIRACFGNVVVTAEGIAREDGGLNESIRVYNTTTKKTMVCMVIDSKTVMIGSEGG